MARNMQIFHHLRKQATKKKIQNTTQNKVKRHTPILRKKEVQPNQVKPIIILIPTYKSNHKHNAKSRGKKN